MSDITQREREKESEGTYRLKIQDREGRYRNLNHQSSEIILHSPKCIITLNKEQSPVRTF